MDRCVLLVLMCAGVVWAPSCADSESDIRLPVNLTTTATPSVTSSPNPEQLVARIRALVRALKDADQLLKALREFRNQQGDDARDAVLKVMKDDANRTLVEQVRAAMEKSPGTKHVDFKRTVANNASSITPKRKFSMSSNKNGTKSVQSSSFTFGKKSPKTTNSSMTNRVARISLKHKKTSVNTENRTTSSRQLLSESSEGITRLTSRKDNSTSNDTIVVQTKNDPFLGSYKVVIKDLTPAASGGLKGRHNSGGGKDPPRKKDMSLIIPPQWLVPPVLGTSPPAERGRIRFQDSLPSPSSTAPVPAAANRLPTTSSQEKQAKAAGKSSKPRSTLPSNNSTPKSTALKKNGIKSLTTTTQKVSATLRTAPLEREEASAAERKPVETPIIANIFPMFGPGAEIPRIEKPFVPFGNPVMPSTILLPPLPEKEAETEKNETRQAKDLPENPLVDNQTVNISTTTSTTVSTPKTYFLGETPWMPMVAPATTRPTPTTPAIESPSTDGFMDLKRLRPVQAMTIPKMKILPLKASQADADGDPGHDFSRWRPSKEWQFTVKQDNLLYQSSRQPRLPYSPQRLDHDLQDLQVQLQLQPEMPFSVAETMYYRMRPSDIDGAFGSIPGLPGKDYPAYSRPPNTRFTCADFGRKGYYADLASRCQAFYVCHGDGRGEAMLCPNGTVFSQEVLVCDWWFNVDCKYK